MLGFALSAPAGAARLNEAVRLGFFPQWAPITIGKMCVPAEENSYNMHCIFTANRKDSYLITGTAVDAAKGAADLAAQFCIATGFKKDRASKPLDVDVRPGGMEGSAIIGVRSLYCETPKGW